MEITIRGDKLKVTDAIKDYIEEKIGKLDKYIEGNKDVKAHVLIKVKNHNQIVEITIPLKSFILRSEEAQDDLYAAIDKTVDKLERQIRKNKTRLMSKKIKNEDFIINDIEDYEDDKKDIIKRKRIEIKPMSEEEAIIQMELLNHQFYLYKDSDTDAFSLIYKRKDGNYGIIETE